MNPYFLRLDSISYQSDPGSYIVENVSFVLEPGKIVTLIGPNGAGQTTLVKLMLGLINPTSGKIDKNPGLTIGYMPQKIHVNPFLPISVEAFLALHTQSLCDERSWYEERLGIKKLYEKKIQKLSGGEWQRVLLMRCLLRKPDLMILDEPTQGVDIFGQQDMYSFFSELRDHKGITLFIVAHDLHFVLKSSDLVLCLNRHLCCSGTPSDIIQKEAYQALFPKLGFYHHHHDHRHG